MVPRLSLSPGSARAEKRVALVIGNGAYENVARLANPIKDAGTLADMFRKAGFDWVRLKTNVSKLEFIRALREFMDAAQDADIAALYYAGHGIQAGDMNYMIPVDAKLTTELDAEDEAVSLDRIARALEPAKRLRLIILDACRDSPFERIMKRRVAVRAVGGGLARMEPVFADTLIAYAAKAGSVAEDGAGGNSPFAAALVENLLVPGLDIRVAFGRVRDDVLKRTENRQEPFVYGSLGGQSISLVAAPAQPKVDALGGPKSDYELAERIGTQEAWKAFLTSHKEGLYADLARAQLDKLMQSESKPTGSARPQGAALATVDPNALPKPAAAGGPGASGAARIPDTCGRDEERLAKLRPHASQSWARDELKDIGQNTTCDRVRSQAVLLLVDPPAVSASPPISQAANMATPPGAANGVGF